MTFKEVHTDNEATVRRAKNAGNSCNNFRKSVEDQKRRFRERLDRDIAVLKSLGFDQRRMDIIRELTFGRSLL